MSKRLAVCGPLALAALAVSGAGTPALAQDFVPIFNGRDLSGWEVPAGDNGHWKVENGVIDYDAMSEATGDKSLWTQKEYGDFVLRLEWRIKETPYVNPNVPIIRHDGSHKKGPDGKEIKLQVPDSDSGVYLRGSSKSQVNIWCWPTGSGEVYGYRTDAAQPPEVRAAVTPKVKADAPIGHWNRFRISMKGERLDVWLNDQAVITGTRLPGVPKRGALALQHHGSPLQFANLFIRGG